MSYLTLGIMDAGKQRLTKRGHQGDGTWGRFTPRSKAEEAAPNLGDLRKNVSAIRCDVMNRGRTWAFLKWDTDWRQNEIHFEAFLRCRLLFLLYIGSDFEPVARAGL